MIYLQLWIRASSEDFMINVRIRLGIKHQVQEQFAINSVPGDRHHFQEDFAINSVPLDRFPRRLRDRFCDLIVHQNQEDSVIKSVPGDQHHFQEDFEISYVPWDRTSFPRRLRDRFCAFGSYIIIKKISWFIMCREIEQLFQEDVVINSVSWSQTSYPRRFCGHLPFEHSGNLRNHVHELWLSK